MIQATRLTRRFGQRTVVEDLSFDVRRAEIVALLGPNGAGKTTTLRMLAGLIAPSSGSVTIDGLPLSRQNGAAIRSRIGFLTEAPGLWDRLTIRENLSVYAGLYGVDGGEPAIDRLLQVFDLTRHADLRGAELSKGMRQKVAIARALLHEPMILLLDEPTAGLDPEIARSVRTILRERRAAGCSILVSTHNLQEAEQLSDRVAVLQGRLRAIDTPAALRRHLTTGRVFVSVSGDAARFLDVARGFDREAQADCTTLSVRLAELDRQVPALVRALVNAGAGLTEVRPEVPALEEVYLQLVSGPSGSGDVQ